MKLSDLLIADPLWRVTVLCFRGVLVNNKKLILIVDRNSVSTT